MRIPEVHYTRRNDAMAAATERLWGTGRITAAAPGLAGWGDFCSRFERAACDAATASAVVRAMYTSDIGPLLADLAGVHVHIGARVCAQADSGKVLVSDAARHALRAGLVARDVGTRELKGVEEPVHLFEVSLA